MARMQREGSGTGGHLWPAVFQGSEHRKPSCPAWTHSQTTGGLAASAHPRDHDVNRSRKNLQMCTDLQLGAVRHSAPLPAQGHSLAPPRRAPNRDLKLRPCLGETNRGSASWAAAPAQTNTGPGSPESRMGDATGRRAPEPIQSRRLVLGQEGPLPSPTGPASCQQLSRVGRGALGRAEG